MFSRKMLPLWRGLVALMLSLVILTSLGYGIADAWRSTVDNALGTQSFLTDTANIKYKSTYKSGEELMNAAKAISVREGEEGAVVMKNEGGALPLVKGESIALFGLASYAPYMSAAGNSDAVDLVAALENGGFALDSTVRAFYEKLMNKHTVTSTHPWTGQEVVNTVYDMRQNTSAGDYTTFKIIEATPDMWEDRGGAASDWRDSVTAKTAIVTFSRPGGEGTTYKPYSALDMNGNATGKNPLALSEDELSVVAEAKKVCDKVIVLLNTSCAMEIGELKAAKAAEGYGVDAIVFVGIPNDYQFTGIVNVLAGTDGERFVNPSGALADTYATISTSSPAMMNFGGGYYTDYNIVKDFDDKRFPGVDIGNDVTGSFGGSASYSGGYYIVEAEGIYTGYNYYETRYFDAVMGSGNASGSAGVYASPDNKWNYADEVSYTFGHGLSYIPYTQKLVSVDVEDRVGGNVTARIELKNEGENEGLLLAQLYVSVPYTDYDRENGVEKSAVMFLGSAKARVGAGKSETVTVTVPTKYLASYDYTNAKTYIMDGGDYRFTAGAGAHEAVNNVLAYLGKTTADGMTGDGDKTNVKVWTKSGGVDTTTYSHSESGARITNVADNADLNYYLPGAVTDLTRSDWQGTYPKNYNEEKITLADSPKKDEWLKELRNIQYTVKTDSPESNVYGVAGTTFAEITDEAAANIDDPFWDKLTAAITLDEAVGAVAHGGSQSDTLKNIDNPVVVQNDGPNGFNGKRLSTNNGTEGTDPYYVDPASEAGKFIAAVNSQTLLGSGFNPEVALEWGRVLGNTGLYIGNYQIWGGGLNYHRTPYNGRNTEYLSEDPMLTNALGKALILGTSEFGIINGPKHIGFNDQEHDRSGICVYMNEQKLRETDLRAFQGAVEDAGSLGIMVAFNRIGAINASHHVGMLKGIVRGEWGFDGLISTDMMNNAYYFNPEGCIMATVTQMADFMGDNSTISGGTGGVDATWGYLSLPVVKNDSTLASAARDCMKYQLFAFARSAVRNLTTVPVTPWWEALLITAIVVSSVLSAGAVAVYVLTVVKSSREDREHGVY